jgi:hypothetical protein
LTSAEVIEVRARVAVLRGLYGDVADNLHDPTECNGLWAQIEIEQTHLATVLTGSGVDETSERDIG